MVSNWADTCPATSLQWKNRKMYFARQQVYYGRTGKCTLLGSQIFLPSGKENMRIVIHEESIWDSC